jgi:hypothetical protein
MLGKVDFSEAAVAERVEAVRPIKAMEVLPAVAKA